MKETLITICIAMMTITGIMGFQSCQDQPAPATGEPVTRSDAKVFYHEGCQYLKFQATSQNSAIHSETCPNHPMRIKGVTTFPGGYERFDYGWNLKEGNYTFICPNGAKVVFYDRDIIRDSTIGDGDEFVTITGDGMTLHVPANL